MLVLIVAAFGAQEVFLVDRKEQYYHVRGLNFPSPQNGINHANTVLDGELVIDVDPVTQVERLRLLCFDCLVCEAKSLIMRPLENRYGVRGRADDRADRSVSARMCHQAVRASAQSDA